MPSRKTVSWWDFNSKLVGKGGLNERDEIVSVRCWGSQNQSWSWRRERVGEWIRKGWWRREKMGREQECGRAREVDGEEVVMMKKEVVSAP